MIIYTIHYIIFIKIIQSLYYVQSIIIISKSSIVKSSLMSKHRHSKDRMFITYTELKDDWGGKKSQKKLPFAKLPFYCCGLSLFPFQNPVCTTDGNVFDILYIVPFIKKYHRNPVNGKTLKTSELIKMHWTKNDKNQYEDPISYKIFTQYTHIVCIKTSGYVYAYDTIQQLNKKSKFYFDLVTNQPFTLEDIITIQDPKNNKNQQVANFDHIKNNTPFVPPEKLQPEITGNQSMNTIMNEFSSKKRQKIQRQEQQILKKKKIKSQLQSREDVKGFIEWCIENKIYKHAVETDYNSASLTSTNFTPNIKAMTNQRELKQEQIRQKIYKQIKKNHMKGLVQIMTNLGNINCIVHADLVPRTSQNFIELTQSGYYDNTSFHRLVKDFCLQGGDPSGTGSGGQSIFNGKGFPDEFHPSLTHQKPGVLSMANSGPDTNRSQFFITLGSAKHLDNKHSVFGEVISNEALLYHINKNLTSKSNKPKEPILITKMFCYDNPFRKAIKKLKQVNLKESNAEEKSQKQQERWLDDGQNQFKISNEKTKKKQQSSISDKILDNYY